VHIDTIVPTVTISAPPTPEQNAPFVLTITFSEPVNGFAVPADLTIGLVAEQGVTSATPIATATLTSGTIEGASVYTVRITPNPAGAEGDITVQVNANTVQDFALNANTAASAVTPSVHIDTIVPTVTISAPPTPEQNAPFVLTITFSEPVNGFAVPADLTIGLVAEQGVTSATPIATATLTSGTIEGASVYTVRITPNPAGAEGDVTGPATASLTSGSAAASVYTVTITPNLISEGDVTVRVNANAVQDFALNNNTAASAVTS
jgi:hypothetical protein